MDQVNVLVVEDNELHAEKIEFLLEDLDFTICGIVNNALDALSIFNENEPDLVLLDITIEGSFSGIDLAERIRKTSKVPIVYISSMRDKETFDKAKATSPDAFIYKPIEEETLVAAIELALHKKIDSIAETNNSYKQWTESVFIRVGNTLKKIELNQIVFIEVSAKNYCDIRTNKKRYSLKTSLSDIQKQINSNQFVRVSRSHIVNLKYIEAINEKDGYIETGFETILFSRTYKEELLGLLKLL